jgi:hypothetical protein
MRQPGVSTVRFVKLATYDITLWATVRAASADLRWHRAESKRRTTVIAEWHTDVALAPSSLSTTHHPATHVAGPAAGLLERDIPWEFQGWLAGTAIDRTS